MYGLLLENLSEYIKKMYGEDRWEEIRRMANVDQPSFSVHQVYCETLIPRLAKKSQEVLFTFNYIHKNIHLNVFIILLSICLNSYIICF